jgi:hypothetical protein
MSIRVAQLERTIGCILLTLTVLAITSFLSLLLLVHLWDRYEAETVALGFNGIYERFQAGFSDDPNASASAKAERARQDTVGPQRHAPAQVLREEPKLVGTVALGSTNQGMSVALSADSSTAIVGGPGPNNADRDRSPYVGPAGAAWVFTRSHGIWTQQGNKLIGTTSEYGGGLWSQGASVAMSADGNTAIVGGPSDNRTTGAAWVFTRSGGIWTQQGNKLVGAGTARAGEPPLPPGQGMAVALSGDGNTAMVGGWGAEATWVFARNGNVWAQQGKKLVGTGAVGRARQGMSVALSLDGNTALVGGWSDNGKTGAAWVFTRKGGVWTQEGNKVVGTGAVGRANQGWSVALSADGNTAIIGGPRDNPWDASVPFGLGAAGAAWVFTRSSGVWTQQGEKLVSTGNARQGTSVALSADGNIAVVGGIAENGRGVASVFTRDGDHWTQDQNLVGTGAVGNSVPSVALSADGSIVLMGAANDNGGVGTAWVFTHSGGHWTEVKKLVGGGGAGHSEPSVALPADGSIVVIGGSNDARGFGAVPVFTPSGGGSDYQGSLTPSTLSNLAE